MGKLSLIGLGLYDEKDLTLKGIEEAKQADEVFIDTYTGIWHGNLKKLQKIIGKKIQPLTRKDLEDNSSKLLEKAKNGKIAIFVQGDPLVATTHSSLILGARKMKIKTKVIHNSSIFSAIAESGLHIQKFGETVTIPFLERTGGKLPFSVYEIIKNNKNSGLHTLCLLDVLVEEKRFMKISDAVKVLIELENKKQEKILNPDSYIIILCRLGCDKSIILKNKIKHFINYRNEELPATIIIPGNLHFSEKDFLNELR